ATRMYDDDTTIWDPKGRIHQVEYAAKAIQQGSPVVGIASKEYVVIGGLKLSPNKYDEPYEKINKVDTHIGMAMSGLISDGRVLCNFARTRSMQYRLTYQRPLPVNRLVSELGDKAQSNTQGFGNRPYGVGLLVAGYDDKGPHLYDFQPTGVVSNCLAYSIGSRSNVSRTYLEKYIDEYENGKSSRRELIEHVIKAIKISAPEIKDKKTKEVKPLTVDNISIGVVGKSADGEFEAFHLLDKETLLEFFGGDGAAPVAAASGGSGDGTESMDVEQ
ncbi:Proteasome subunit alpha type-6, partial [Spiromyces aspiralis]